MTIKKIYAQLSCSDLERSGDWFRRLFGREPDACPMDGLREWHHGTQAGLQLFENAKAAGHGTLTLIVSDIADEHLRLEDADLNPGKIERADTVDLVRLNDPDGNLIVFAEPKSL